MVVAESHPNAPLNFISFCSMNLLLTFPFSNIMISFYLYYYFCFLIPEEGTDLIFRNNLWLTSGFVCGVRAVNSDGATAQTLFYQTQLNVCESLPELMGQMEMEPPCHRPVILLLSLQGDAFNTISHNDARSPAALGTDEPLTATTSNIKEPRGLFDASSFLQRRRFHDSSSAICSEKRGATRSCRAKQTIHRKCNHQPRVIKTSTHTSNFTLPIENWSNLTGK